MVESDVYSKFTWATIRHEQRKERSIIRAWITDIDRPGGRDPFDSSKETP